jgi:hypothetical protein
VHQPFSVFHLVSRYLAPNPCRCGGILQRFDPSRPPVPLGPGQLRLPGQRRVALRQLHSGPLQCLLPALTQAKARTLTAQSLLGFETAGDPLRPDKNEPRVSDQLLEQDRLLAPVQDPSQPPFVAVALPQLLANFTAEVRSMPDVRALASK